MAGCQDIGVSERHPLVPSNVWGWRDAFNLQQLPEHFGRAFESYAREAAVRKNHASEYFAADFETQIVAPRHIFDCVRKGETEFADPFDVGHGKMIARERANANRSHLLKQQIDQYGKIAFRFEYRATSGEPFAALY